MTRAVCEICPHRCSLEEGQTGLCRARSNHGGSVQSDSYGLITSMALDPVEKKPLMRFFPGSFLLSVGSFGCNMHCPFCQNYEISQKSKAESFYKEVSPKNLFPKPSSFFRGETSASHSPTTSLLSAMNMYSIHPFSHTKADSRPCLSRTDS